MPRLEAIKAWYSAEVGQVIELEDDVLGIVRQVHELYDRRIAINFDPQMECYHLTEHCDDGTERLIFSTDELDGRTLERLQMADSQWRYHEDPYDRVEREQDEAMAAIDARYRDQLSEHGERLLSAMKRDGKAPRLPLRVAMSIRKKDRIRRADH